MQFEEAKSKTALCPVCKKNKVVIRNVREPINTCSKACKSQLRYATRYTGTLAGPKDKPTMAEKTKF